VKRGARQAKSGHIGCVGGWHRLPVPQAHENKAVPAIKRSCNSCICNKFIGRGGFWHSLQIPFKKRFVYLLRTINRTHPLDEIDALRPDLLRNTTIYLRFTCQTSRVSQLKNGCGPTISHPVGAFWKKVSGLPKTFYKDKTI
jgi:hypothetical protein